MKSLAAGVALLSFSLAGCGGNAPPAETPEAPTEEDDTPRLAEADEGPPVGPSVMAEIGGLPPEGVANTFKKAEKKIFKCFTQGIKRVEFMGGAVRFWVKVDQKGKFMHAHLERSDLGDRTTEQCLLDVLIAYTWPKPVGGEVGVATFEMSFEHAPDIQPPVEWKASQVSDTVGAIEEAVDECKSGMPGKFIATVYVKKAQGEPEKEGDDPPEIGRAVAASATPPDEAGEMVINCLVDVLKGATFPSPGANPAKVVFDL